MAAVLFFVCICEYSALISSALTDSALDLVKNVNFLPTVSLHPTCRAASSETGKYLNVSQGYWNSALIKKNQWAWSHLLDFWVKLRYCELTAGTADNDKPRGGGYFLETGTALDICDFHSFQDVPMQYFPSESLSWRLEGASFWLNSD